MIKEKNPLYSAEDMLDLACFLSKLENISRRDWSFETKYGGRLTCTDLDPGIELVIQYREERDRWTAKLSNCNNNWVTAYGEDPVKAYLALVERYYSNKNPRNPKETYGLVLIG